LHEYILVGVRPGEADRTRGGLGTSGLLDMRLRLDMAKMSISTLFTVAGSGVGVDCSLAWTDSGARTGVGTGAGIVVGAGVGVGTGVGEDQSGRVAVGGTGVGAGRAQGVMGERAMAR
jgi:hypothetical protein